MRSRWRPSGFAARPRSSCTAFVGVLETPKMRPLPARREPKEVDGNSPGGPVTHRWLLARDQRISVHLERGTSQSAKPVCDPHVRFVTFDQRWYSIGLGSVRLGWPHSTVAPSASLHPSHLQVLVL
jgi:hypothetical protein